MIHIGMIRAQVAKFTVAPAVLAAALSPLMYAQAPAAQNDTKAAPAAVPVIDGAIGPCSADFVVTDPDGKPVYAATIKVHIEYGFMYLRKLDLQVGTNADGKARFTGLPDRTKRGLFFEASSGDLSAEAFVDSATNCKPQLTVVLRKKP